MPNISVICSDEVFNQIEAIADNKSDWLRQLIDKELGKKEKSLQDYELELEEIHKKEAELNEKINIIIDKLREQKLTANIIEEQQIKIREQQDKEFYNNLVNILDKFDFITNFEYVDKWNSIGNLMPLVDILRENNIRLGYIQLLKFLEMRKKLTGK